MKPVRFAIIGCGFIGKLHAGVIQSLPQATLVGICNAHEEQGQKLADAWNCRYYNHYQDVLSDRAIDAVAICTPSGLHHEITIAAARAGKHVICEKPIEIDIARARDMVDVCRDNQIIFSVIMQHRFDEPVLLLQKAIAAGQLGRLLWGAARTIWYRDDQYYANPWRGTWQFDGGGALINQSIHYIDLLISVLGDVQSVSAKCRTRLHQQIEVEDVGVANLEFVNGTIGTIEGTTAAYPGLYAELAIFGEKGTVIIRNDQLLFYRLQNGALPSFDVLLQPEKANALHLDATISDASHRRQYQDFIAAIQEDRKPLVSGEDALSSLKVIKAIYQASQEKREIYL
jgi:UDP-N-acetyl-2-amino-2-deoxyglucuronate dehydrogenase